MSFSVSLPPVFPPQIRFCTRCPLCFLPPFFLLSHLHCFAPSLPPHAFGALSVTVKSEHVASPYAAALFKANWCLIICLPGFSLISLCFTKKVFFPYSAPLSPVTQACPLGAQANHCSSTDALIKSVPRRRLQERGHNGLPPTPPSEASFSSAHIRIVHRVPLLSR